MIATWPPWAQDLGARGEDAGETCQQAVVADVGEVAAVERAAVAVVAFADLVDADLPVRADQAVHRRPVR